MFSNTKPAKPTLKQLSATKSTTEEKQQDNSVNFFGDLSAFSAATTNQQSSDNDLDLLSSLTHPSNMLTPSSNSVSQSNSSQHQLLSSNTLSSSLTPSATPLTTASTTVLTGPLIIPTEPNTPMSLNDLNVALEAIRPSKNFDMTIIIFDQYRGSAVETIV